MIESIAWLLDRLLVAGGGGWSGREVCLACQVVEGGLAGAGPGAQAAGCGRAGVGELGEAGAEQVVVA